MSEITRGVTGMPFVIATDSDLAGRQLNAVEQRRLAENDRNAKNAAEWEAASLHWMAERDQFKAEIDRLKQENRLLTEHNEFLASSDSRLAPDLRAVKDALGLDFTASVGGEVVPAIEAMRKDASCVDDLSALVRQLVQKLRKATPDSDLPDKALDYLKRKGLQGIPYRSGRDESTDRAARVIYEGWSDQPGYVPWVDGGNSTKQDEARRIAMSKAEQ